MKIFTFLTHFILQLISFAANSHCSGLHDPAELKIIELAKKDPFQLLLFAPLKDNNDAKSFLVYFILHHFKVNNSESFMQHIKKLMSEYEEIPILKEFLRSCIQIKDKTCSLEEFFLSNGLFFFKNKLQPANSHLNSILKAISDLLPEFYPEQASILKKFLTPLPDFDHKILHQKDLSIFYYSLLQFIFNRPVNFHDFKSIFDRFEPQGRNVLASFIKDLWGIDCLIEHELSIEKVNMLIFNQHELKFVKTLQEVDFEIARLEGKWHPEIDIIYGRIEFKETLTFLEYLNKFGLFYTLANWMNEILCQRFLKHVFNKKTQLFFDSLVNLQKVSNLELIGRIFYRYFVKGNPTINADIQLVTALNPQDYELIKIWQLELKGFSTNFLIQRGESNESIHDALLELQISSECKSVKALAELIFDSLIFGKDFSFILNEKQSLEASYFKEFLSRKNCWGFCTTDEKNLIDRRSLLKIVDFELSHGNDKLSKYLFNRARFFDSKRKPNCVEISFEHQIDNVLRIVGKVINYQKILESSALDIFIENALGKLELSDMHISFLQSLNQPELRGLCNAIPEKSLNYIIEETDSEKIRFYLKELTRNPKIIVCRVLAKLFLATIAQDDQYFGVEIVKIENTTKNQEVLSLFEKFLTIRVQIKEERGFQDLEVVILEYGILYVLAFADRFRYQDPKDFDYSQDILRTTKVQMAIKSSEFFPLEFKRFNKFIQSLGELDKLYGWEVNLPQILFDLCFKPEQKKRGFDYFYNLPLPALEYLGRWQLLFMGYNNDLVKSRRSEKELLSAMYELEFTQFEREVAYLIAIQFSNYSNDNFIKEVAVIRQRCEILNTQSEEKIFEEQGAIRALALPTTTPLIRRIYRALQLISKRVLPIERATKVIHYIQKLPFLGPVIGSIPDPHPLHNLLIHSYLGFSLGEETDLAPITQLSKKHRKNLGFFHFKLAGYYSEVGFHHVQDVPAIKSALMEMGGRIFSFRNSVGSFNITIEKLYEDLDD
jgi:hypothetical protein